MKTLARKFLIEETDSTFIQFFRYGIVGGFAFMVDFASLYCFTEYLGIYYLTSAALAFILGLITNYLLSIIWVFKSRTIQNRYIEFLVFGAIGAVGLVLNELIIWFFTEKVALHYMMSKLISTAIVYLWNFFIRKFMLFR